MYIRHFKKAAILLIPTFMFSSMTPLSSSLKSDLQAQELTLDDCFKSALKISESVADQNEALYQANEKKKQAIGYLFPTINFFASYTKQEAIPATDSTGTRIYPSSQPLLKVTGTQPLFRGFRDFAALSQTGADKKAKLELKKAAMIELYKETAHAFYNVLAFDKDLENLKTELEFLQKRVKEIKDRVKIGKSRESEVLTTDSSVSILEAEIENIKGQTDVARILLSSKTSLPKESLLKDTVEVPDKVESLENYLGLAGLRPDVKAAELSTLAARKNIKIASGAHFPSADFNGNYYFMRSGSQEDVDWDFNLVLTMPLFAGGVLSSKVREAKSVELQAELNEKLVKRLANEEIKTLYNQFASYMAQLKALEKATDLAEKNYKLQNREYRLGLVSNLDFLDSFQDYLKSLRTLDSAKYDAKLTLVKLNASVAREPQIPEN